MCVCERVRMSVCVVGSKDECECVSERVWGCASAHT